MFLKNNMLGVKIMIQKFTSSSEYLVSKSNPDKNGTVTLEKMIVCTRCNGTGQYRYISMGKITYGTCFKCDGKGAVQIKYKQYTEKHRAKLDSINERKRDAKRIKLLKKEHENLINEFGEVSDYIYKVVEKDIVSLKEEIKKKGGKYEDFLGWFFTKKQNIFQVKKVQVSDFVDVNDEGFYRLNEEKYRKKEIEQKRSEKAFVGEIKEKIKIPLIYVKENSYETPWGRTYIRTFKDTSGNNLVWRTSVVMSYEWLIGEQKDVSFIVKEHGYYSNEKQTYIKNLRFKKNKQPDDYA
jgi:hypothetical protein